MRGKSFANLWGKDKHLEYSLILHGLKTVVVGSPLGSMTSPGTVG